MERFIDAVRRYPCLWNTAAIEYRDQELKDAAWAELVKETDVSSVKEAKLKWKKLRDSYRDALKRASESAARGEAGAATKRAYPWKYAARMQFLQPYIGSRRRAESPAAAAPPSDSGSESEPAPRRPRRADEDALDTFFRGMCQATRRLPAPAQIAIKKTLFGCVIAAEEACLQRALWPRREPSSSGSDAPPS